MHESLPQLLSIFSKQTKTNRFGNQLLIICFHHFSLQLSKKKKKIPIRRPAFDKIIILLLWFRIVISDDTDRYERGISFRYRRAFCRLEEENRLCQHVRLCCVSVCVCVDLCVHVRSHTYTYTCTHVSTHKHTHLSFVYVYM